MTILVALLAAAFFIAIGVFVRRCLARARDANWLPPELRGAELAFAEKTFRAWRPLRLIARLDRAYRLNGTLHLAEFKTRGIAASYPSDVIELSAQRLAIEAETGQQISDQGYVLVQRPQSRRRSVHRVQLWRTSEIVQLAKRRAAILNGTVEPRYATNTGLCRKCAYRPECKPEFR